MPKNDLILSFTFNGSFNANDLSKNTEQFRNLFQSVWESVHSSQELFQCSLYETYMEMVLVPYTTDFQSWWKEVTVNHSGIIFLKELEP